MTSPYSPTLQTPRLLITLTDPPNDLAFRHQLFTDWFEPGSEEYKKWNVKVIERFLATSAEAHKIGAPNGPPPASYIVRLKPTEEFPEGQRIGGINFFVRREGTPPEIGFSFLKSHQKMGYGTEAIGEVVRHVRDDCGMKEIHASTSESNIGCQKTLQKIGFVPGGWVEMFIINRWEKLVSFVLPGMKPLEGQKLRWVGSDLNFDD